MRTKAPSFCSGTAAAIWINFDRHELLSLVHEMQGQFIANTDDIRPQFRTDENAFLSQNAIFQSQLIRNNGFSVAATIDQYGDARLDDVGQPIMKRCVVWVSTRCFAAGTKISLARARADGIDSSAMNHRAPSRVEPGAGSGLYMKTADRWPLWPGVHRAASQPWPDSLERRLSARKNAKYRRCEAESGHLAYKRPCGPPCLCSGDGGQRRSGSSDRHR